MRPTHCKHCGSAEFEVSNFRRKDFSAKFYFIECKKCGSTIGMMNIRDVVDAYKGRNSFDKRLASKILSRNHEGLFPSPEAALTISAKN